ncbi:hypothetical protein [Mycobacterium sp. SMC-4]|uniref:hypothetical protein n=1 Tax=Mycobacterium sp. SMC-4 TaxID=2857059 RepID=UPI0021B19C9A|nr:hypothetical protein [Mycobacterium sp. SMC-4]UXA19277.1 hypothetical protein KXD98_06525 [Mycobacterium sp. SMC-4]
MGLVFGGFGGAAGVAAPAAAQNPAPVWVMPDVRGMLLQRAVNAVSSIAAPEELTFRYVDTKGVREVKNLTNWTVCATSPSRGSRINPETKRVIMAVKRAADTTCY